MWQKLTQALIIYMLRKVKESVRKPLVDEDWSLLEINYHHVPSSTIICFIFCTHWGDITGLEQLVVWFWAHHLAWQWINFYNITSKLPWHVWTNLKSFFFLSLTIDFNWRRAYKNGTLFVFSTTILLLVLLNQTFLCLKKEID